MLGAAAATRCARRRIPLSSRPLRPTAPAPPHCRRLFTSSKRKSDSELAADGKHAPKEEERKGKGKEKADPDTLPFLGRPLGVREPPSTRAPSWEERRAELLDQDKRLAKRDHLCVPQLSVSRAR
jgi:hypothetical protein